MRRGREAGPDLSDTWSQHKRFKIYPENGGDMEHIWMQETHLPFGNLPLATGQKLSLIGGGGGFLLKIHVLRSWPQYLRMWLLWDMGLWRGNSVNIRDYGWALIQDFWCHYKKRTIGQTPSRKTKWGHGGKTVIYKEGETPQKKPNCQHLDLGLPIGRTMGKYIPSFKLSGLWHFVTAARADSQDTTQAAAVASQRRTDWGPGWAWPGGDGQMAQDCSENLREGPWPDTSPSLKCFGCADKGRAWWQFHLIWKTNLIALFPPQRTDWAPKSLQPTSSNRSILSSHLLVKVAFSKAWSHQKQFLSKWIRSFFFLLEQKHTQGHTLLIVLWKLGTWTFLMAFTVNSFRSNTHIYI